MARNAPGPDDTGKFAEIIRRGYMNGKRNGEQPGGCSPLSKLTLSYI